MGYDTKEIESIPKSSILGVGCGAPIHHAQLREGETVVDQVLEQELMYFYQPTGSAIQVE